MQKLKTQASTSLSQPWKKNEGFDFAQPALEKNEGFDFAQPALEKNEGFDFAQPACI